MTPTTKTNMRLEDHLNRARLLWNSNQPRIHNEFIEEVLTAIALAAGGGVSVLSARRALSQAFKEDPDFRRTYLDNIACLLMDFERWRHREPGTESGPMTAEERRILAERILVVIFE